MLTKELAKEETGGETFTYEPKEDDKIDQKFAEIYNDSNNGANAYPVKKLEGDANSLNWRFYEFKGFKIIMELYNGDSWYLICREKGMDT